MPELTVRPYTIADFDALLQIQKEAFPPPFPEELWWSREHIEAHVSTFPEGGMMVFADGEPAGSATSLVTTLQNGHHTWEEVADDGYIRGTHDPDGDTLYGIDLCVRPSFRGAGAAGALYQARFDLVRRLGLRRYVAGARIPDFQGQELGIDAYLEAVAAGEKKDQVLSFMLKQGLHIVEAIPDYLDDEESGNYGVLVEWRNPDFS
ncbi:GNAT family N-acetyltransferase [Alkalicoccus chagannorensis]|uniref:GNAT family N-acetyltransferase n=1 Tax=Alkalicoccus chagannorensis TaxID=427072 RepID=UPI0004070BED|nr:GNAT family N-acetyltransferase [Alkalicoccus chagannorensis]